MIGATYIMVMDKPIATYPNSPTSMPSPMPFNIPDVSVRAEAYDQILKNRGIRVIHRRALVCPNVLALDTNSHTPECPNCDNSGFMYYGDREIIGTFNGNSMEKTFEQHGVWEIGTAVMTFPSEYADGTEADFQQFDRLEIPDFTVRLYELLEYLPTADNTQSVRYDIEKVDFMVVTNVGPKLAQRIFNVGVDFNIVNGDIVWVDGKQPNYDASAQRGQVIAVAYYANPIYIVIQSLRELRITQEMDPATGMKVARRMPQEVLVRRDFLVHNVSSLPGPA